MIFNVGPVPLRKTFSQTAPHFRDSIESTTLSQPISEIFLESQPFPR